VKAMKKLPKARPSADFTGHDLMRRTPCSALSRRHSGAKRSSVATSVLLTGVPL
jgi:hypothetical protein